MNYAAERHFVSPDSALPGGGESGGLPWEVDAGASASRHDTWLLSFIDILALLLTLFVLLLAYQDSETKLADARPLPVQESTPVFDISLDAPGRIFRQPLLIPADARVSEGYAMPGPGLLPVDAAAGQPVARIDVAAVSGERTVEESQVVQAGDEPVADDAPIQAEEKAPEETVRAEPVPDEMPSQPATDAVDALLEVFKTSELRDKVEVAVHPGEVNLEISDSILFSRASAALTDEGIALLKELAEALAGQPYTLSVEGHTDNVPIETARYPSNWELSSARAAVVTRRLIEQGIASDKVRAIGYGATRPLADNDSPEGRARNRRVSFILQVDVGESGQLKTSLR
ncbi:MAG: flagellar motor protein MotB [Thiogranum sp.]